MKIADKFTWIDIRAEDINAGTLSYLYGQEQYWRDLDDDLQEHLYSISCLYKDEVKEWKGLSEKVVSELQKIKKLAEENDAPYFRIIFT